MGATGAAAELLREADVVDLHCTTEVPARLVGWDPSLRHATRARPRPLLGQVDFPRLGEAGYTGVVWDITTNPFRSRRGRQAATLANIARAKARIGTLVTDLPGYRRAREAGDLACWLSLQGGNALIHDPAVLEGETGALLHRITLVHMTRSGLGGAASPLGGDRGLTPAGAAFVEVCNRARILVDLAHATQSTFWQALDVHTGALPPVVSHTAMSAVYPSWRSIDDDQVRAIAERGGVVGIIFHSQYLEGRLLRGRRAAILDHLEHLVRVGGEGAAALGSDYDGMIVPPADLPLERSMQLLVGDMLERGWSEARIRGVLGANYLRVVGEMR